MNTVIKKVSLNRHNTGCELIDEHADHQLSLKWIYQIDGNTKSKDTWEGMELDIPEYQKLVVMEISKRRNTENQKHLGNKISINLRNMETPFTMYHILALAQT